MRKCRYGLMLATICLVTGAIVMIYSGASEADPAELGWRQAWAVILENNPGLDSARQAINSARAALKLSAVPTKVTAGLSGNSSKEEGGRSSSSAGLTLSYNTSLFGREKASIEAEKAGLNEAEMAYHSAVLRLYRNAATAFWGAAAGEASVKAAREEIVKREAFLKDAKLRFEQGMVPELDVMRAESALAEAHHTLALREANRSGFQAMLKGLAGWMEIRPAEGLFDLSEPVVPREMPPDYSTVAKSHPTVMKAVRARDRAQALLKAAEMISVPTLGLSATRTLVTDGPASQQYTQDEWWGRATLTIPVIDGGQARWATERARAGFGSSESALGAATADVMMALFSAWEEYIAAVKGYEAEQSRFDLVSREREIVLLRYREGLANQIEVLDAQTRFSGSLASLIDAKRGLFVAEASLAAAEGKLPLEE